jgi:hypothetical protein
VVRTQSTPKSVFTLHPLIQPWRADAIDDDRPRGDAQEASLANLSNWSWEKGDPDRVSVWLMVNGASNADFDLPSMTLSATVLTRPSAFWPQVPPLCGSTALSRRQRDIYPLPRAKNPGPVSV